MARTRSLRGRAAAFAALLLTGCFAASPAAAASSGRKLKQITFFADTPDVATSTSLDGEAQLRLGPDGTVRAAGGATRSSTTSLAASLLNTFGDFNNRPRAASSAYVQVPLALSFTQRPSIGYGLAESQGDVAAFSSGQYAVGEFGYNPISNNLGLSGAAGTSDSLNVAQGDLAIPTESGEFGFSGIEFVGTADDQTRLADARTSQLSQALAYPTNLINVLNPLTCAQTLTASWTLANYDVGAPGGPLPRGDPPALIPYCLQFFNFATLDDFGSFIDETFGVDNGPFTNDFVIATPTTVGPGDFSAPPSSDSAGDGAGTGSSFSTAGGTTSTTGGGSATPLRSGAGSSSSSAGPKTAQRAGGAVQVTDGSKEGARAAARTSGDEKGRPPVLSFGDSLDQIVSSMGPGAQAFFQDTPVGQDLVKRVAEGPLADLANGSAEILSKGTLDAARGLVEPVTKFNQALSNLTGTIAANATNLLTKTAVQAIEAAQPLLELGVNMQNNVTDPISKLGARLAAKSYDQLVQQVRTMPAGPTRAAVLQSLQQRTAASDAAQPADEEVPVAGR